MPTIETTQLQCGATLVSERMSGVRSAGLTWLVACGSSRDPEDRQGLCAMHAEMLLRGAGSLDSRAQADAFDRLGVDRSSRVETFTTSVRATMLGERMDEALGLLASMVVEPRMDASQVEPVRALCVSAIQAMADEPQERVMVNLRRAHAPAPINRSEHGTLEGVGAVEGDRLLETWRERAMPRGSIIAVAGEVDAARVADRLDGLLEGWSGSSGEVSAGGTSERGYHHEEEKTDQIHIALAHDSPAEGSDEAWLERVGTAVLSGGMSGRLFTELRERRSLCYTVWASFGADRTYGRTVAYSGTTPERAQETLDLLIGELSAVGKGDRAVTPEELERAKVGMKSRLVFAGESSSARATALAHDMRKIGRARGLDEMARRIDGVTLGALNEYLGARDLGRMTVATVGPRRLDVNI